MGTSSGFDKAAGEHIDRRVVWERKYAIRACYGGWYERMRPYIVEGRSLEVGCGSGNFKSFWPELMVSDVVETSYVDFVADAELLPVESGSLSNLVVIDLLHHLQDPQVFLDEAGRVLRPGGRILMIEPYITLLSFFCYRALHHEEVCFGGYQRRGAGRDPWQGNLAMMNILLGGGFRRWAERHRSLVIIKQQLFGVLDFQLAGGFKPYAFLGNRRLYDLALRLDRALDWLGWLCGFRVFCVIENKSTE
ncbi:MAG: class I SAM-dependent methyltransferase [Planctomycetota bacterium]